MQLAHEHYLEFLAATEVWHGTRPAPGCLSLLMNEEGNGQPLFWCGQNDEEISSLARRLAGKRTVYGLKSTAYVVPTNNAHVAALAEHYATEIVRINPTGPYYLGGYCAGGMLAFEIAHCLLARSKKVELLALVEVSFDGLAHDVNRRIARLSEHARTFTSLSLAKRWPYLVERLGIGKRRRAVGGRNRQSGHAQMRADGFFEFRDYPGRALFLFARDGVNSRFKYSAFQKRLRFCQGGSRVRMLPGAHAVFTSDDAVDALIDALNLEYAADEDRALTQLDKSAPMPR